VSEVTEVDGSEKRQTKSGVGGAGYEHASAYQPKFACSLKNDGVTCNFALLFRAAS